MVVDQLVRAKVGEVLVRYATGIDRRDWDLFRTCFTDDLVADYGDIGTWEGAASITEWMRRAHEPCGHTLHRISNESISPVGEHVVARSYVDAIIMDAENTSGMRAAGFYDDVFTQAHSEWRIARRTFTLVLMETELGRGHRG
jgi:3-phenylpropionate/cinnamic acid dioxygenase small subunit